MKKLFAACCAAFVLVVIAAPFAHAATEVNVRIEGKEETLFEKTIPVTIGPIQASSDTQSRNCDGVNELDPENEVPGVTPTLASAEAMESIGETFDGDWYEGFGDYFITRWGPDEQDNLAGAYWGILVNNTLTSVGGCQYQLDQSDEVLWLYDAFSSRPMLALFPEAAHYTEGPRPTRVTVAPGEAVPLEVVSYAAGGEGVSPEVPSRVGSTAYAGASVAPVTVNAKGFQRVETASPEAAITNAEGKASVTFTTPGIHRIKATVGAPGDEHTVVRSNGLEVCVLVTPGDCGEPPVGGETGTSPGTGTGTGAGPGGDTGTGTSTGNGSGAPAGGGTTSGSTTAGPPTPTAARISRPQLSRAGLAGGKLTLSWTVLDPGAGVKGWTVATKAIGAKGGFVTRAHGTAATEATLRLPRGHRYRVRFILTDLSGHTTAYGLGQVSVPRAGRN
jgi:hypothetical protein